MAEEASLAEKVAFLRQPAAFPGEQGCVETIETHFAWVFLCGRSVYKLKKPIRFGLIDFRQREARHAYCELEVSLNRRLAEKVYLRVVALSASSTGLAIGGEGESVDWMVEMRRLPRERTLAESGHRGAIADECLAAVVSKLVTFYRRSPRSPWNGEEYRSALDRRDARRAWRLSGIWAGELLSDHDLERLAARQAQFVDRNAALLAQRAEDGRIVEAHGDLRAEHVFLMPNPQIIDCLEFSIELRWLDAAEELSFLALDCERLGMAPIGRRILDLYRQIANDEVPRGLLEFYRSRRAFDRALLAAARVPEAGSDADEWRARARWYLAVSKASIEAAFGT